MSKTIKIQSTKNGFNVVKTKVIANEKYIIADETGKPLNKLKFVQKNKNLEIYTDVNGKEQQVAILEDYYAPDMNASVVGFGQTSEELAYAYNANDGWSYLELPETAFGFATPLLGLGAAGAAGAGIAIANNDKNNENANNNTNAAQASILAQIGNEGDNPDTVNSVVTTIQLATLSGITGVVVANEDAYQDYIDANPDLFSSPATLAEVQAMITAVNAAQASILAQIGNEGDNPDTVNSVVTTIQLATLSGITGVVVANEDAYQDYIDANPDLFSSPATLAEVQAMITAVNAAQASILAQIGNEGDNPDTVNSVVTTIQLATLSGITGVVVANEDAYQDYIDANPDSFSSPATLAEVQAMITAVNAAQASILAQIGNEGDNPDTVNSVVTTIQLATLSGITGVVVANEDAYQDYIDANPDSFSSPATLAEVQAMITAVNITPTTAISSYADNVGAITNANSTATSTDDTTPGFNVGAMPADANSIVLYVNGVEVASTYNSTAQTLTPNTPLGEGTYSITYAYKDINGNTSTQSPAFSLTTDITPPSFPVVNLQGSQVKLEATFVTNGADYNPQITAVGSAGEYVVTYFGIDSNGDNSIFVQKFNADGTIQGSQVMLEATGVTNGGDQYSEITAVGNAGEYVVTYHGIDSNGDNSIFVQKFNADGTIQGSQVMLEGVGVSNGIDSTPQITAVGNTGEYVVTYFGIDSNGDNSIFVQKFNADGTIQGSQVMLEGVGVTNGNDFRPQITAVGNTGEYVVTYFGIDSNGDNSIFVQKFNADGTIQGSQVMLEGVGVTNGIDQFPQITAVGTAGEYVVTYRGIDNNGDYSIFVQKFNVDGTIQGSQVMLEAIGVTNGNDFRPQITAVGTAGEYAVTYYGIDSNGDNSIFVQKFNADGTIQGSQVKLEATGVTNGADINSEITAVGTTGEYVVTYHGTDSNGDNSIFVQKFNADGTIQGSQVMLEAIGVTNGSDANPQIKAVGNAGEYVVTYYGLDSDGDTSIFVQKFNANGTIQGSQVKLEGTGVTNGADGNPQIKAVGNVGEYVVTFTGIDSNGDYSIFVQKFNADGTPVEGVTVAENTANTTVVFDANATDNGGANDVGITYSISGGVDASKFTIDPVSGEVIFVASPDYENPTDVGGNNVYDIIIRATDIAGNSTDKNVAINVTDIFEIPTATVVLNKTALKIGETATLTITFSEVPLNFVEADDLTLEHGTLSGGSFDVTGKIYTATFIPTANIEDSTNVITLGTSWNNSSNNAPASTSVSGNVAIDTIAPATLSLTLNTDTGINSIDGYTSNGLVDVTGIEVGNTWKYSIDGGNTWIDGVGSSFTLPADTYGANDIQVKQIDAVGNEVITSEVKGNALSTVKLDGITTAGQDSNPQITTLSDGSYVVTWSGTDTNGDASIFVQKFNADGTTTGNNPVTLEGIPTGQDQFPQIKALNNGEYVVTWYGQNTNGVNSIYVQKFNADGTTTGNTPVILDGISNGDNMSPQITSLPNGEYVVTWQGTDNNLDNSIFVQKFNADGTTTGNTPVTLEGIPTGEDVSAQITSLSNGEYVVTWQGRDTNGSSSIFVQKFNTDGTTSGNAQVTLEGISTNEDESAQITSLSNGEYVVIWQGRDVNGDTSTFVQKFNADGTTTGNTPVTLEGIPTGADEAPQITSFSDGSYVVTWHGIDTNGSNSIFVQKFNSNGTITGNNPVTLEGIPSGNDYNPQITTLIDESYVVTWQGTDVNGDNSIFVQKFNADGSLTGNSMTTLSGIPNGNDYVPQITALIDGSYVVTWQAEDTNGDTSIFVQQFDANGLPIKVIYTDITVDTGISNTPIIDTIATDDIVNASEQSSAITGTCEAGAIVSLSIGGNTREATVTGTSWSYTLSGADITAMGQGAETITATQTDQGGNTSVIPASKNITVDTTAPDFPIINVESPQVKLEGSGVTSGFDILPQIIAVGTAGEYVITYRGVDSNGDSSIFVQKFNADGTIQGSQVMLEATGVINGTDQYPQITAVGTAGEYVVTYYGTDSNGDDSIFVQKFNTDGTIQGSQVILEGTGVSNGVDTLPQITAVGTTGEYVVTYTGTDNTGDSSIFVQKFNANGTIQGSQVKLEGTGVTNGSDQYPQITAVGTTGEYVVTFSGLDSNGDISIFVQKFNADGTIQGSQVILEATGFTNRNDITPQITAVGNAGEYVVTYRGADGGYSIFVQKFNADGTIQGSQVKLEATGVTNGINQYPQITAVGTAGEYVVTYNGIDSNGDNSIFVQKFNSDGTIQGSQVMLEATGVTNREDYTPQITAVGTTGEYVVTYYGLDSDGDYSIFVQKFNADGTIQGSQVKLEATGVTNGGDQSPQITAVGTTGEYVVTYQGIDSDGDQSIFVQKFNADGTPENLVESLTVAENTVNTTVIFDANATDNGGANDVGITYSIIGGADANKFTINSAGEVRFVTSPDYENPTDVGGNNVYDIIIRASDSVGNSTDKNMSVKVTNINEPVLRMSMAISAGFMPSPLMHEATGVTNADDINPQITPIGNNGEYIVTYQGIDSNGDYSIFVQKFNANGTILGSQTRIEATAVTTGDDINPQITPVGNMGEYVVTFQGIDSNGDSSIFVQKFNNDGTTQGSKVKLEATSVSNGADTNAQITTVGTAGEYVVTYQGMDSNGDTSVFVQKFNADGTIQGTQEKLEAIGMTTLEDFEPQIVDLIDGSYVVAFCGADIPFGDWTIFVQKFNADGTITGNNMVKLEVTTYGADLPPHIISLPNGGYVVSWSGEDTNGVPSIFVQKFNANGTTTGNSLVTLEGIVNQGDWGNNITALNDGSYVVNFQGKDPYGNYSVYVQKFNADGTITGNSSVMLNGFPSGHNNAGIISNIFWHMME